jgi:S1-C subfamily serine protease
VNGVDLVVLLVALAASYTGWRHGFVGRALSWIGLSLGIVLGALFVDDITNELRDETPQTRLLGALAFMVVVALIGQALGHVAGSAARRWLPHGVTASTADRSFGAAAGIVSVLVGVWLLTPAFASAAGWPATAARGSAIVRAVNAYAPAPPDSLTALGRLVGDAPFPEVFERLTSPDAGPAPGGGLAPDVYARVAPSVVKVESPVCDRIQEGSGFVVRDGLVLTNAHVVAGASETAVEGPDGRRRTATIIGFDPNRDVALLSVPGLALPTLARDAGVVDEPGSVIGYPGGGSQTESPARIAEQIDARGSDIYRETEVTRDVFVLAAALQPGDSGAPLFDQEGDVVGLAFAIDPSDDATAYALTTAELEAALATFGTTEVSSGPCLVG